MFSPPSPPTRATCAFLLLAALAQGILLVLSLAGQAPPLAQFLSANTLNCVLLLTLTLPPTLALLATRLRDARLWQHTALLVLAQCAMLAWANWNKAAPHINTAPIWLPLAAGVALALFVSLPWLQGRQRHGRWRVPYADLFELAWQNALCLLLALLFTGIGWAILMLWAELFNLVKITEFRKLFRSETFFFLATSVLFMLGILIAHSQHKPVQMLRHILFAICKGLLPVLAAIAVLFAASLPLTGLEPLWQTGYAAWILTLLIAILVTLTNAVWQDGDTDKSGKPYPRSLRRVVELGLLTLPLYAALTLVALGLRIEQYGWTVGRVFGMLIALLASGYALGYAFAVLRTWIKRGDAPSAWLMPLAPVNQFLSWVIILLAVLANTPVLDAYRISAASQIARLRTDIAHLDSDMLKYLRFDNGRRGFEALQSLRDDPRMADTPLAASQGWWQHDGDIRLEVSTPLHTLISITLESQYRWKVPELKRHAPTPSFITDVATLRVHIPLAQGSPEPGDAWWQQLVQGQLQPIACLNADSTCVARMAELDGDNRSGVPDVLLCHVEHRPDSTATETARCAIHGLKSGQNSGPADPIWHTQGRTVLQWNPNDDIDGQTMDLKTALQQRPLRTWAQRWPRLMLGEKPMQEIREVYGYDK